MKTHIVVSKVSNKHFNKKFGSVNCLLQKKIEKKAFVELVLIFNHTEHFMINVVTYSNKAHFKHRYTVTKNT